jgi:hypothetical protein
MMHDARLSVTDLEEVAARADAQLVLSERQGAPSVLHSLMWCAGSALVGFFAIKFAILSLFLLVLVQLSLGAAFVFLPRHRAVGILAFPDYFLVLRSKAIRIGWIVHWSGLTGPGEIVAVLERRKDLRVEERVPAPRLREIVAFDQGRLSIVMSGTLGEDESIEILHRVRAFLDGTVQTASPDDASRKGTLQ